MLMNELLTEMQRQQLLAAWETQNELNPMVYVKIDVPALKRSWYIVACHENGAFYGFTDHPWPEFISFSEADFYAMWERGGMDVLPDHTFQPCRLQQLRTRLGR